jgi:hypothetical protein
MTGYDFKKLGLTLLGNPENGGNVICCDTGAG